MVTVNIHMPNLVCQFLIKSLIREGERHEYIARCVGEKLVLSPIAKPWIHF